MSDHKFEPFDRVLVRDGILTAWVPAFFASILPGVQPRYETISGVGYLRCIPYTPETAHLLGTNAPYEPPKPPHEYKWGDKVEVRNADGKWNEAVFINFDPEDFFPFAVMIKGHISLEYFQKENIRPLEPSDE